MCRLYGMTASHPTRAACELLDAQNALIRQAVEDGRGLDNPHGWGVGLSRDGDTECARQVEPADASEEFRQRALHSAADTLVAHVRRATVGDPSYENTHPFRYGDSFLAHNGHVGAFDDVRPMLLDALPSAFRERIRGSTDSEHVFQLTLAEDDDEDSRTEALRSAAGMLRQWTENVGDDVDLFLNTLWCDDGRLCGTKLERTLYYLERDEPIVCDLCDAPHADPGDEPYRSIVIASEPITDEEWSPVPAASVFRVTDDYSLEVDSLF